MTILNIEHGQIAGIMNGDIHCFLGIPFAAPIVPGRRFEAPQDVIPWTGVRDAKTLGAICPQVATYGPVGRGATSVHTAGEDYLTVNVRSTDINGQAPVLVWLHGGGYAVGSGNEPIMQTGAFARSGVVEVTLNYRLGALGFLSIEGKPDNRGLLDIIKALQWVQRNIASFGGDPARVTLAGRSAGGFAVSTLMAMPAASGLFSQALIQSGATPAILSRDDACHITKRFVALMNVKTDDLEHVAIEDLLEAQRVICDECYEHHDFSRDGGVAIVGIPFQPVIDGQSLPTHPEEAASSGKVTRVPVMIGTTSAEYLTHSEMHNDVTLEQVVDLLDPRVRVLGLTGQQIVSRYQELLPDHLPLGVWRAVAGDLVFQNPTTRYAKILGENQNVFKYLYGQLDPDETGAAHGAELGYVWWNPDIDPKTLPHRFQDTDAELADYVHDLWVRFIKGVLPITADGAHWPEYSSRRSDILFVSKKEIKISGDPFVTRLALW